MSFTERGENNGSDNYHAEPHDYSTFNVTANFYSHLDYQSRISSAEVIASALGGESETEENEDNNKKTGS